MIIKVRNIYFFILRIILIIAIFFCIFPFIWMLYHSLNVEAININFVNSITLNNYEYIINKVPIGRYLLNSVFLCFSCVLGTLFSCSLGAYSFSRIKWKNRNIIFMILLLGFMFPSIITMIPIFIMWSKVGIINSYIPLIIPSWLGGSTFSLYLLRQYFLKIPQSLDDAAKIDGANHLQILFRILIPMSKPAIIVIIILSFLVKWSDFLEPLIYLNNPNQYTLTLGLQVFNAGNLTRWNVLMAACVICVIPIIIIYLILIKIVSKDKFDYLI